MHRRSFVVGLAVFVSTPSIGEAASSEKYPISQSDILKVPAKFRRKRVSFDDLYAPGTIVVDTKRKYLFFVEGDGTALRYGIGVGRQGFSWAGSAVIKRKAKWPTWTPPAAMVARDPFAAKWANGMPGGPGNPLGARALYLYQGDVDTLYRIHGTIVPSSIGKAVSSGCIRMINADVADLYERVSPGARVVVLQKGLNNDGDELMSDDETDDMEQEEQRPRKRRRRFFLFGSSGNEDL